MEGFEIGEQNKSLKDERKRNENKASKILIRKFDRSCSLLYSLVLFLIGTEFGT